jgi:hypothetical protein|tara:strand:+ start:70 stop:360 length:291 start_codon:yes stop_codon:yes gene_type:complete
MPEMFKKNIQLFIVLFALLLNVQASLSHDVEHVFHNTNNELEHDNEDCLLKHNLVTSNGLEKSFRFDLLSGNSFFNNDKITNFLVVRFTPYQSRAP